MSIVCGIWIGSDRAKCDEDERADVVTVAIKSACLHSQTALATLADQLHMQHTHLSRGLRTNSLALNRLVEASPEFWLELFPDLVDITKVDREALIARLAPVAPAATAVETRLHSLEGLVGELLQAQMRTAQRKRA